MHQVTQLGWPSWLPDPTAPGADGSPPIACPLTADVGGCKYFSQKAVNYAIQAATVRGYVIAGGIGLVGIVGGYFLGKHGKK